MSFTRWVYLLLLLALGPFSVRGDNWEKQLERYAEALVAKHGTGTDQQLKLQLKKMARRDQAVRTGEYVADDASSERVKEQEQVDSQLTSELKSIVKQKGWPTIQMVGLQGSENAMLILTHSGDHDFQREMLPTLQQLAEAEEILRYSVAGVVDKILVSEGKPQRFGTQFKWPHGVGEMLPVEDPEHLEERRARYLLQPLAEYKRALEKQYSITIR